MAQTSDAPDVSTVPAQPVIPVPSDIKTDDVPDTATSAPKEISYDDAFVTKNSSSPPEVPLAGGGKQELSYAEAFGKPEEPSLAQILLFPTPKTGNIADYLTSSGSLYQSAINIGNAFGDSVKQTKDDIIENLTGSGGGEFVESMRRNGIFEPYVKDQEDFDRAHNYKTAIPSTLAFLDKTIFTPQVRETLARVVAAAGNVGMARWDEIGSVLGQASEELPGPVRELSDYALNSPMVADLHDVPVKEALRDLSSRVPKQVAESEAAGVIGTTEAQNEGTQPLTPDQHVKQTVATAETNPIEAPAPLTNDIHGVARSIDPETFGKYDQLSSDRDDLRQKLTEAEPNSQEFLDTRQQLQETNAELRNLSPQVSRAYLEAEKYQPNIESIPGNETEPLPEQKEELAEKTSPIVSDVAKKLTDAGLPEDQAQASGEVAARMYQYFADVYGGEKGTAQDWYNREQASVVAGKERATILAQKPDEGTDLEQNAKGKIRLAGDDANAVITLMKNADASTFVHESAHHFLDMMDRFSKEDGVPDQLKSDMASIRKWTGLSEKDFETPKEKKIWVQAHEKFARGFERYLMEGVAPNRDMAMVFAKFKQWLTSIYKTYFSIPNQRGGINEDVRGFFDRVMSTTPEKTIIAPEINLKKNISNPQLGDLFSTVPKAPESLTEWLAKKGGVKDDGSGDLQAMDADKAHIDLKTGRPKPFANKLVKDTGMDLDEAARQAHEAGYFPEKGTERPTVEELKNKVLEDLTGNKQYSDKDQEGLTNHQEALKYNAQIEQISHETGIDTAGKTTEQFYDEIDKYYRDQKHYEEAQERADSAAHDFEEYERKQREFVESRGDAWEPPKEPDHATLEDLENEYKQEQASHDAGGRALNPQGSQFPAGTGEPGEAGSGQGGRGSGTDGRGAEEVAAREAAARQQLDAARADIASVPTGEAPKQDTGRSGPNDAAGEQRYFDKAGNVRLDLLTDNESVKAALREDAEKNPQIFNHGIVTDAQVAEFADTMGVEAKNLNIQKLRDLSVNDAIPLAARIRSGSRMMVDALNHSLELMNKANPTDEDAVKFLEAKEQYMMIAETVSATTNEMGRAFRAYNNIKKEYNLKDIGEITDLFQRMTSRTLDQVKQEMKAGSILKTPKQVAKFTNASLEPTFMDKLIEYRNNSLLSGPVTHTYYTAGGFFNALYKPLQTLAGVATQNIREAMGDEVTERMYAHEALSQFNAMGYGSYRGLKAAIESWKNNSELALPKEITSAPLLNILNKTGLESVPGAKDLGWLPHKQAIDGKLGAVINAPGRLVGSIHSFQKMLTYQQNLAALATREALGKFEPGTDEYNKFISDQIENPTAKMMDTAGSSSLKEVYREKVDYNSLPGKLFNIINSNSATKVLFPFIKMQYNIKRLAFRDNSVLGFFSPEVQKDLSGANGDVAKNMAIGKISAGTAIAGLGITMTMQGINNGNGPSDPKAYKTWRLTHTPYAVQIGSLVIPHKALGTWGQLLGWSADLAEGAHEFDSKNIEKSSLEFVRKASAIFTEEGFLTQAKNTLDAAFTPGQFGTRFIQNFATQWLPFSVGFSQTNRLLGDPYSRRIKSNGIDNLWGVPESMAYKYPGTSELLQPNRDMFGRPITFDSSYDQYATDPVVQKLESLNTGIGRLSDKIKNVQLTEQQYDDYSRIAGQMTYARLSKVIQIPGFNKMPPQHQMTLIEKTVTDCRHLAATNVMKMNHDLITQATAKKKMSIYGNVQVNDAEETEDRQNP